MLVAQLLTQARNPAPARNHLANFLKLNPPSFEFSANPAGAEDWIAEMEKLFDVQNYSEEKKVRFAAFRLKGNALDWWKWTKTRYEQAGTPFTWEGFKNDFFAKYFPISVRRLKENEFLNFVQGNMDVRRYEAKFNSLSRFTSRFVATEEDQAARFEVGLNPIIKAGVAPFELKVYRNLVDKALVVEEVQKEVNRAMYRQIPQQQRPRQVAPAQGNSGQKKRPLEGNQSSSSAKKTPCTDCGRLHNGECLMGKGVCFYCKKPGHLRDDCPASPKPGTTSRNFAPSRSFIPAKAFVMTQEDADQSANVISGMLTLSFLLIGFVKCMIK